MHIEKHLFNDINFFPDKMKILILGTFPVPLYSNEEKFKKLSNEEKNNSWYYSSKRSEFWKLIAESFDIDYNDSIFNKKFKKKLFEENRVGIADVFSKCVRKNKESARDTDLIIIEYNNLIGDVVNDENNYKDLELIIFTSRFTENNFFKILNDKKIDYFIEESNEVYEYYKNCNFKISVDIINALRERYLNIKKSKKIKIATITLKISPIKGVSLYSTKKELYRYYLKSVIK